MNLAEALCERLPADTREEMAVKCLESTAQEVVRAKIGMTTLGNYQCLPVHYPEFHYPKVQGKIGFEATSQNELELLKVFGLFGVLKYQVQREFYWPGEPEPGESKKMRDPLILWGLTAKNEWLVVEFVCTAIRPLEGNSYARADSYAGRYLNFEEALETIGISLIEKTLSRQIDYWRSTYDGKFHQVCRLDDSTRNMREFVRAVVDKAAER